MIEVSLDRYELEQAAMVGVRRRVESIHRKLKGTLQMENGWQHDVEGAIAERIVAKALGMYWNGGVCTWKAPDIDPNIQVRSSRNPDSALIVRENDADDEAFVLVTGSAPNYVIRGWSYGRDAKKEEWVKNPYGKGPAYFMDQKYLNPIETLPK